MDRYLDSLFDPVLSEGSEVRYIIHSLGHTWPPERGIFSQQFTFNCQLPYSCSVKLLFQRITKVKKKNLHSRHNKILRALFIQFPYSEI